MTPDISLARALRFLDDVWSEQSRLTSIARPSAGPASVPDISFEAAERRAEVGKRLLRNAEALDLATLPHDVRLTVLTAKSLADRWSRAGDWWWLVQDLTGVGFYGMFGPTAYSGGFLLNSLNGLLATQTFKRRGDADRYLALVSDHVDFFRQLRLRLEGQAERQIVMARPQLEQAQSLVAKLSAKLPAALGVGDERLTGLEDAERFRRELNALIEGPVAEAVGDLEAFLGGDYAGRAGERVGLGQYPGGKEIYEALVKLHTTLDLTPEEVHARGVERMAEVRAQMAEIRASVGFAGDDADYLRAVAANPAWRAQGAEQIGAVFQRYIDRIAPHIDRVFRFRPTAPHGIAALPEALEGAMSFGFYQQPSKSGDVGRYLFNAANLSNGPLNNVAALNYHELVPGHHFHLATQMENETLHPLRVNSFVNAFNEGWAEYAATLAGELGMYREPEERFGRLMMDAFLTSRLVVDTGMNAFDWSLERARDYMRENAFMPETEVRSETVRYSCDIPGQALAYKLGETHLLKERERMSAALGDRFDLKDFHDAVLAPGALELRLVSENVTRAIEGVQ